MIALQLFWKFRAFTIPLLIVLVIGAVFGILTHKVNEAEKEAKANAENANRAAQQADAMKIILNANTQAAEIEREKQNAKELETNSNSANANFNRSVRRDSSEMSGNFADARKRFCANFPNDSACK